jgi:hypothetical protein
MKRRFNDTGVCVPDRHFMVDTSRKTSRIFKMVEQGDYFVINRPRQYGKTTILYMLNRLLLDSPGYFPVKISFEGIGSESYKTEAAFIDAFLLRLKPVFERTAGSPLVDFIDKSNDIHSINRLDNWLTQLIGQTGQKAVLMIDEVDKSCNNQLFLDFLGMLRDKYLKTRQGEDHSFHSVLLAGVHDVKSLKVRPETEAKYNSPWNIAVDFDVDLGFSANEIVSMLEAYASEQQVTVDAAYFSRRLFYFTSGYPFLVSYLCKIIDEKILPGKKKKQWQPDDLVQALQLSLLKENTNFQSVIKNLENNNQLYEFVFKIIMNGQSFSYNPHNSVIQLGAMYGVLGEEKGKVKVHNRLYEQLIYNYMSSQLETSGGVAFHAVSSSYIREDGSLDIEKVIRKFQRFMKEQYSQKDQDFIERNGRLLFLAFLKPIINGRGFDFKEVEISEEKRLDIVITFGKWKYIVELKIWRGESYHQAGIKQLCDYLDRQDKKTGYLLIYDLRKETGKSGDWETIDAQGKTISAAWI